MKQPLWVYGRVPNGFWSIRANRVAYMKWLGKRLRYRKPEDWYGLTRTAFRDHFGGGLLATVYGDSPLMALQDYLPDYDWKPWLLTSAPQSYWHSVRNRRKYMAWLGEQLGYREVEDWYALSQRDFRAHGGGGLLGIYYGNSSLNALKEFKPRVKWREWEFAATPQRFWRVPENRRRYMAWLGKRLGYKRPEDWYQITRRDFHEHGGGAFLREYRHSSPLLALREYLPKYDWKEWLFTRVPNGFWRDYENRHRYVRWLGKTLGYRGVRAWYNLTREDVRATGGGAMLSMYYKNSLLNLLRDHFPSHKWDATKLYKQHGLAEAVAKNDDVVRRRPMAA